MDQGLVPAAETAFEQHWCMSNPTPEYLKAKEFFVLGWERGKEAPEHFVVVHEERDGVSIVGVYGTFEEAREVASRRYAYIERWQGDESRVIGYSWNGVTSTPT